MVNRRVSLIVLSVGVLVAVVFWRMRATPERAIRKRLDALVESVSRRPAESNSIMALKVTRLQHLFADTVEVEIQGFPANGRYSSGDISSQVARLRPMFSRIDLVFYDVNITLNGPDAAQVELTARLTVEHASGGGNSEIRELLIGLSRHDGVWLFGSFREPLVLLK